MIIETVSELNSQAVKHTTHNYCVFRKNDKFTNAIIGAHPHVLQILKWTVFFVPAVKLQRLQMPKDLRQNPQRTKTIQQARDWILQSLSINYLLEKCVKFVS